MALRAKDIAQILGVSTATVSLAINNRPGISEATREEILKKIKELDGGHLLRENISERKNIGFVIFKRQGAIIDESPFFAYFLEGISTKLSSLNYNLSVLYMNSDMAAGEQRRILDGSMCAGFIVFAVEMIYEDMRVFKESGYPFVMLDNSFFENDVDTVAINNVSGIRTAINYLIQKGHRRIGYIRSKIQINSFDERFQAYLNTMRFNDLPVNEEDIAMVGYSDPEARNDMYLFLKGKESLPTAFISDNDLVACGAMKGMTDAGLRIPDDVSIIGFDDRPIAATAFPPLTTMMVPKDAFGGNCVDLLVQKILEPREYARKSDIGTILVERKSVKSI